MSIKHLRAKLHGIKVTGSELNYHGSITLDPAHCNMITIYPLEFVEIWNKNNGERYKVRPRKISPRDKQINPVIYNQ